MKLSTVILVAIFSLLTATVLTAKPGVISGIVRAEGRNEVEQSGAGGKYDSRKYKFVERINYEELRDFVVFIEGRTRNELRVAEISQSVLTQKDAIFRPHVLPVYLGTTVKWPNQDDIFHNVFSMSEPKQFDLGLYKGSPAEKAIKFDKAGRVDVFCSIHSAMHCIILVLENPYFALADESGRYVIKNVPPGNYQLKAWHERLPPQTQDITVTEASTLKVDFTLGIRNLPKY